MRENGSAALRASVALTVLVAGYVGLAYFLGRHVPANTSVAGVPIGGMSPASAERTLDRALADRRDQKVVLVAGDAKQELSPADAGLRLDLPGTVDGLTGFSLKPADLWAHLTGGGDQKLAVVVDPARGHDPVAFLVTTCRRWVRNSSRASPQ